MKQRLLRTELLLGKNSVEKLQTSHVLIVGLGGVGGYTLEALARTGIGKFTLIDSDKFDETNLNRQILCTSYNVGQYKTYTAKERLQAIDCDILCKTEELFLDRNNIEDVFKENYTLVVDAIDSVDSKCMLIKYCTENNIPIVSSMGAGFRTDPTKVRMSTVAEAFGDPLAKKVRQQLALMGVGMDVPCVFSVEKPVKHDFQTIASIASVTGSMGLALAQLAINIILKQNQ